jgi:hypothetical protein
MTMSKGQTFQRDLLDLIFNATSIAGLADDAGSPVTDIHCGLHTASPGEAGNQTTFEATYLPYARVPVARTSGGFTRTLSSVSPNANVDFPPCSSGTETLTDFHVGMTSFGTGKILYYGDVAPDIAVSVGVTPRLTSASTIAED